MLENTVGCDKAFRFQKENVQSVHRALQGRTENEEEGRRAQCCQKATRPLNYYTEN